MNGHQVSVDDFLAARDEFHLSHDANYDEFLSANGRQVEANRLQKGILYSCVDFLD